jgi:rod shape-determining protein MreD
VRHPWLRVLAILLPALLLDESLSRLIALKGTRPDLALIGMLVVILRFGTNTAVWAGFLSGLFLDVATPENLGARALSLATSAFLVSRASEHVDSRSLPVQLVLLLVLGLFDGIVHELASHATDLGLALVAFVRIDLVDLVYTVLVAAPILGFAGRQLVPSRAAWRSAR